MDIRVNNILVNFPSNKANNYSVANFRVLTSWMFEVSLMYELPRNILALGLKLLNNFIIIKRVPVKKFQLVGSCCLFISIELSDLLHISIGNFVDLSEDAFTTGEFDEMVIEIIKTLNGKIRPITALDILGGMIYDGSDDVNILSHARNIALILYIYYPKYYGIKTTSLVDLCVNTAKYIVNKINGSDNEKEIVGSIHVIIDSMTDEMKDYLSDTLNILPRTTMITKRLISNTTFPTKELYKNGKKIDCDELEVLGAGTFGTVRRVRCDNKELVMKDQVVKHAAFNELSVLSTYKDHNIIEMKAFKFEGEMLEIYMELGLPMNKLVYFDNVDRYKYWELCYINKVSGLFNVIEVNFRHKLMMDIIYGINYLHSCGIIHRDIKLDNIVVVNNVAKIVDFGISYQACLSSNDKSDKSTNVFTVMNRPIELLFKPYDNNHYGFEVDIWALATVLLEIEVGIMPFYWGAKDDDIIYYGVGVYEPVVIWTIAKILGSPFKVGMYKDFPYDYKSTELLCIEDSRLRELMFEMLSYYPNQRPTIGDVRDRFSQLV